MVGMWNVQKVRGYLKLRQRQDRQAAALHGQLECQVAQRRLQHRVERRGPVPPARRLTERVQRRAHDHFHLSCEFRTRGLARIVLDAQPPGLLRGGLCKLNGAAEGASRSREERRRERTAELVVV